MIRCSSTRKQANRHHSIKSLLEDETLKAMLAAGTPPHFVYAYQKTGFIVDEAGYKSMSPEDRAEYDAAIDEYFAIEDAHKKGPKQ